MLKIKSIGCIVNILVYGILFGSFVFLAESMHNNDANKTLGILLVIGFPSIATSKALVYKRYYSYPYEDPQMSEILFRLFIRFYFKLLDKL